MTRFDRRRVPPGRSPSIFAIRFVRFVACAGLVLGVDRIARGASPQPIDGIALHNLFRVETNLFSGSAPDSDAAFAELKRLGVSTVLSVDGAKPDLDLARRHGMRYVHLPIGYDGIPNHRVAELTRAARTSGGAIYVHCHHGKHRGPAAAAIIGLATAGWTTNQAVRWLQQAGTAADYAGLYRSIVRFAPPDTKALDSAGPLPEIAPTSSEVDSMVAIDLHFDRLRAAAKAGWSRLPGNPDFAPDHEATLLWERFREMARQPESVSRKDDYRSKMAEAEGLADELRRSLGKKVIEPAEAEARLRALERSCVECHRLHRNG